MIEPCTFDVVRARRGIAVPGAFVVLGLRCDGHQVTQFPFPHTLWRSKALTHIEVIVLRPFLFSEDGYTEKAAKERDTLMLPARLFDGLNAAGKVRRATIGDGHFTLSPAPVVPEPVAPAAVVSAPAENISTVAPETTPTPVATKADAPSDDGVEIPDDWRSMKWFALRSLASKVSDTPVKTMDDAVAAIEAEVAGREAKA